MLRRWMAEAEWSRGHYITTEGNRRKPERPERRACGRHAILFSVLHGGDGTKEREFEFLLRHISTIRVRRSSALGACGGGGAAQTGVSTGRPVCELIREFFTGAAIPPITAIYQIEGLRPYAIRAGLVQTEGCQRPLSPVR
ncbi:hypothetical protein EVAR_22071_1 [Eumeta japonica]|uniref:Uncharacterized protein n=1 Tax=Eumeta variegata TaxID=151549 RepID=A0A4C1UT25_EUMVA|nr:hypothetical protein EVAR_22071_1 [Eumeta japonica]